MSRNMTVLPWDPVSWLLKKSVLKVLSILVIKKRTTQKTPQKTKTNEPTNQKHQHPPQKRKKETNQKTPHTIPKTNPKKSAKPTTKKSQTNKPKKGKKLPACSHIVTCDCLVLCCSKRFPLSVIHSQPALYFHFYVSTCHNERLCQQTTAKW